MGKETGNVLGACSQDPTDHGPQRGLQLAGAMLPSVYSLYQRHSFLPVPVQESSPSASPGAEHMLRCSWSCLAALDQVNHLLKWVRHVNSSSSSVPEIALSSMICPVMPHPSHVLVTYWFESWLSCVITLISVHTVVESYPDTVKEYGATSISYHEALRYCYKMLLL